MEEPQMIELISQSLNYSISDVKWIPGSEKFIVIGCKYERTGILQIFELNDSKLEVVKEFERQKCFGRGSFGATSLRNRHLAVADFDGLQVLDLERPDIPLYNVKAHKCFITSIDVTGDIEFDCGTREIVTGSNDGSVKVWDIRQGGTSPVIDMTNNGLSRSQSCWTVAYGGSYYSNQRSVAAGFGNGDLKLFDLRALSVRWEKTERSGITCIEFDRKDIPMNKMVATTIKGEIIAYDMRTQHANDGFASVKRRNFDESGRSALWSLKHLPQNRDVFVTCSYAGLVRLWEYEYPDNRRKNAGDGHYMGVAGNIHMLNALCVSNRSVRHFDWNTDFIGLGLCGSCDDTVRVLDTTGLKEY